jgi:hypothetical protein
MTLDNRHKIDRPYWARPGFALFAKRADDNDRATDDDLDEDDEDDLDEEDDEEDEDADKSEGDLRAELKAVRASLGKANGSSKRNLRRRRELEAELANRPPAGKKSKGDEVDEDLDVESIRAQAKAEGEKVGNDRVKRAELRTALAKAGVRDEGALKRLSGMVDLDDLDLDDDGNVDGLDDAIEDLRADVPALFDKPRRRRTSVAGDNDRDGGAGRKPAEKTASQRQAESLLRRGH